MKRYLVDANVLLRLVLKDDKEQSASAERQLEFARQAKHSLVVTDITVAEVAWVLQGMGFDKVEIGTALQKLAANDALSFERRHALEAGLAYYMAGKADFADCYLASRALAEGADGVISFDKDMARFPVKWVRPK